MKVIIITGTPCTGKSTLAKELSKYLPAKLLDVNQVINKHKMKESYDKLRDTYIIDTKKLNKVLIGYITQEKKAKTHYLIIESHLSHYLPSKYVSLCIITACDLKILQSRLKKRNYNQAKVRENLDAEIFEIIHHEAKQSHRKISRIDTTKGITLNSLNKIKNHITK
ncbi:AAA family ATPase [Candidatus Woesearchaeota archaeon]|nr:AAA family ATPase [Candidatus Woesearchaeota archaeon]